MTTDRTAPGGLLRLADGLRVSRLGYGAMQLPGPGVWGPPQHRASAIALLRRAVQLGVTHIDTSDFYGPHVANDLIREALHPYPDDLVIATKVGVVRDQWRPGRPPRARPNCASRSSRTCPASVLHTSTWSTSVSVVTGCSSRPTPPSPSRAPRWSTCTAAASSAGWASAVSPRRSSTKPRALAPVVAVQNRYHLFDRTSGDLLAACEQHGIAFVPYFPLAAGMLRPDRDTSQAPPGMAPTQEQGRALDTVAATARREPGPGRVGLAARPIPGHTRDSGTASLAHLEQNVAAADLHLTGEDLEQLDRLASPTAARPTTLVAAARPGGRRRARRSASGSRSRLR